MVELQRLDSVDRQAAIGHTCDRQDLVLVDNLILPAGGRQHKRVPSLPLHRLKQRDDLGTRQHCAGNAGPSDAAL